MRLDIFLVENDLVESRSKATDLIKRNLVLVDGIVATKPGLEVSQKNEISILKKLEYVSRAGLKLEDAINSFNLDFKDKIVTDIGASTGGFTDCALQYGARLVYAYDIGHNQMHESLIQNAKVVVYEDTNILDVSINKSDFILIDVSFTSVIPIIRHLMDQLGTFVVLIKPQFEAGKINFKNGVLKDRIMHISIINDIITKVREYGFSCLFLKASALKGKSGNQEYILIFNKMAIDKVTAKTVKDVVNNA